MKDITIMPIGKYRGVPIEQIPLSYLRWMLTQSFPKNILEIAKKKVEASKYSDIHLSVTRHAIDMFSLRFLQEWLELGEDRPGLGTYIAQEGEVAWEKGIDVSKNRHEDDGIVKDYCQKKWVFKQNKDFPEYKDLITIMPADALDEDDFCGDCNRPLVKCQCPR